MTKTSKTTPTSGTKPQIVFFGSGPVAAESLRLLAQDFKIEGVVTKPRPPHHHGDVPVMSVAEELGLRTLTATNKKELDESFDKQPFESRVGVLVDFGIIISQKVIDYFPLGIVNSHFSVLPEWRGADPITFAILSGQKMTGVSIMLLVEAMDEGPLLGYGEYDLPPDITTPKLTDHLIKLSHALLKNELPIYFNGKTNGAPQDLTGRKVSYSRKLTKADGVLDWAKPAEVLEREIRAFIEWPKSRTTLGDKEVIITAAHVVHGTKGKPGEVATDDNALAIGTSKDMFVIDKLKPAGKKEMTAAEFLRGYGHLLQKKS